ncbi:hypothetical protein A9Q86_02180 [Flavobacteriales bacterium 33_180_T64]|nr:hypothetical protein A9Q86_02180 [Flavobacteriales bacterium 33_180_T64]
MKIEFLVEAPNLLSKDNVKNFEVLLNKQGQIDTVVGKVVRCYRICLVKLNGNPVAIGALKQVYKSPFDYAEVPELSDNYNYEIGYLFVDKENIEDDNGKLGIGKYITRLLLNEVRNDNVFATTEENTDNPMLHILKSTGFKIIGKTYKGNKTNKKLCLMLLERINS